MKFVKVMFSQVYVCSQGGVCLWSQGVSASGLGGGICLWSHGGVCHPPVRHPPRQTSPWADIPRQTPPCPVHAGIHTPLPSACWDTHTPLPSACWDRVNKQAVSIPLECILVYYFNACSWHDCQHLCSPQTFLLCGLLCLCCLFSSHFRVFIVCNIPEYLTLCHNTKVNSMTTNGSIFSGSWELEIEIEIFWRDWDSDTSDH